MGKEINIFAALEDEPEAPKERAEVMVSTFSETPLNETKNVVQLGAAVTTKVVYPIPSNPSAAEAMGDMAKENFAIYTQKIEDMFNSVNKLSVTDVSAHKQCVAVGTTAKKLAKEIDNRFRIVTNPASEYVKVVRNFIKPFIEKLDKIEEISKQKNRDYLSIQELERRKAQKSMEDATAVVQERVNVEAAKAGVEAPIIPQVSIKETPMVTHTDSGSAHLRKKWAYNILNPALIPREYLEVNEQAIRSAIKQTDGQVTIPGVVIFEDTGIIYRT